VRYSLPDGAEYNGTDEDGNDLFLVEIPLDEHGFFGRQCPSCQRTFLVANESYDALPDDLQLWCVYCGHRSDHSDFMSSQQTARIMSLAEDVGRQLVDQMLDTTFGQLGHRRDGVIRFERNPRRPQPRPLPGIHEEQLVRERSCPSCGMRYAVFAEHRFCPACGPLPARQIAVDALEAEASRLDALETLPGDIRAALGEQGVLDRQYVDTIENLVSVVESLASATFSDHVPGAAALLRGRGNVFQRLDDLADLFAAHTSSDLRTALGPQWQELKRAWAGRHLYAHNDGVVDERYTRAVPMTTLQLGQRLPVTRADARTAIENVRVLVETLISA
jgi:hypothetical protein